MKTPLLYSPDQPYPTQTSLRAGTLRLTYENGFIRHMKRGDQEVVRMIYIAVRSRTWETLPFSISNESIDVQHAAFSIRYQADCAFEGTPVFRWQVTIQGESDGQITLAIDGEVLNPFQSNRAGFCLLHPIQGLAGSPVELIHPDGSIQQAVFPQHIDPTEAIFENLSAMGWQTPDGAAYRVDFEGDLFETEDQRNWTDASYKTFCTPLSKPRPIAFKPGDRVHQVIRFKPEQEPTEATGVVEEESLLIPITLGEAITHLPYLGTSAALDYEDNEALLARLSALHLHHIRVDFYADQPESFAMGIRRAKGLFVPLLAVLHLTENGESDVETFLHLVRQHEVPLKAVLLLSEAGKATNVTEAAALLTTVRRALPDAHLGAGTDYNFTELNRNRFDDRSFDFISYSVHPQAHAFDPISLLEATAGQGDTVRSAQALYPGRLVWVSPVTLRMRFNPDIADPAGRRRSDEQRADPRQSSLWAAGWTLSSLKALAEAGAEAVTYFEDAGAQGILEADGQSVFPVYLLWHEIQQFSGGDVLATSTSQPLACSSLLLRKDGFLRMLLANHTPNSIRVRLPLECKALTFRLLTEANLAEALTEPERFTTATGRTNSYPAAPGSEIDTPGGDPVVQEAGLLTLPPFALAVGD